MTNSTIVENNPSALTLAGSEPVHRPARLADTKLLKTEDRSVEEKFETTVEQFESTNQELETTNERLQPTKEEFETTNQEFDQANRVYARTLEKTRCRLCPPGQATHMEFSIESRCAFSGLGPDHR